MLTDQVELILGSLRAQRDNHGHSLPPTAIAIYGLRKLEPLVVGFASNAKEDPTDEIKRAMHLFSLAIRPAPVDPRRYEHIKALAHEAWMKRPQ